MEPYEQQPEPKISHIRVCVVCHPCLERERARCIGGFPCLNCREAGIDGHFDDKAVCDLCKRKRLRKKFEGESRFGDDEESGSEGERERRQGRLAKARRTGGGSSKRTTTRT